MSYNKLAVYKIDGDDRIFLRFEGRDGDLASIHSEWSVGLCPRQFEWVVVLLPAIQNEAARAALSLPGGRYRTKAEAIENATRMIKENFSEY